MKHYTVTIEINVLQKYVQSSVDLGPPQLSVKALIGKLKMSFLNQTTPYRSQWFLTFKKSHEGK